MRSARWRDDSVAHSRTNKGSSRAARAAAAMVVIVKTQASVVTDLRASAARAAQRRPADRGSAVDRPAQTRQEIEAKRSMGQGARVKGDPTGRLRTYISNGWATVNTSHPSGSKKSPRGGRGLWGHSGSSSASMASVRAINSRVDWSRAAKRRSDSSDSAISAAWRLLRMSVIDSIWGNR